jgi:hypothetical protein
LTAGPPNFSQISQLQNSPIPAQRFAFFFFGGKLAIIRGKQRFFFAEKFSQKCQKFN